VTAPKTCHLRDVLPDRPRCNRTWRYLLYTPKRQVVIGVCATHVMPVLAKLSLGSSVMVTRLP
jgi:hypothetical protein